MVPVDLPPSAPAAPNPVGGAPAVVIGVGNDFRRDDGAGPAVIARLRDLAPPGVRLIVTDGEPARLVEAWTGAAQAAPLHPRPAAAPDPGRVHRSVPRPPRPATPGGAPAPGPGPDYRS